MKKFWIRLAIYLGSLTALAWLNNAVLLHFHPLAYYYTPEGLLLSAVVMAVESLVTWPVSLWYNKKILVPALADGLADETTKVVKESYEACARSYADYKNRVVTEFKE